MAEEKSKDAAPKADHEPTAKSEAKGRPKAEQPAGKPIKAEPETKDKPEAKTAAPVAAKTKGSPASTSEKPAPAEPAATASGKGPSEPASAAIGGGTKSAAAEPGAGPSSASGGGSWLISRAAAWVLAIILGLVIVIGFPLLIDSHGDEVADLRAQLEAERQAISEYPNAAAALEAIRSERADVEAQRDAAQAEADALGGPRPRSGLRRSTSGLKLKAARSGRSS